jgi:hypothetical protein
MHSRNAVDRQKDIVLAETEPADLELRVEPGQATAPESPVLRQMPNNHASHFYNSTISLTDPFSDPIPRGIAPPGAVHLRQITEASSSPLGLPHRFHVETAVAMADGKWQMAKGALSPEHFKFEI